MGKRLSQARDAAVTAQPAGTAMYMGPRTPDLNNLIGDSKRFPNQQQSPERQIKEYKETAHSLNECPSDN